MAKFDYPSRYYADDKDVSDLLSEPKFTVRTLRRIARERGIFLSPELPKQTLVEYISQLPFSWPSLLALIRAIETEEKEENTTPIKVATAATMEQFHEAAKEVQALRGQLNSEVYTINVSDESVRLQVKYRELDHRSTRTLQWTDHTIEIHADKTPEGFELRYAATDKGKAIVDSLVKGLPTTAENDNSVRRISLAGIADPEKKTQFFRSIIYGMEGLRPENVKDLRMNRVTTDSSGEKQIETEELTLETKDDGEQVAAEEELGSTEGEEPASMCKRTTLSGDSLLQTPEFQTSCKQGFFISRAVWTAVEKGGQARKFEFEAEYRDSEDGGRFSYRLRGLWSRNEDGELELTRTKIGLVDKETLSKKIEAAAFTAAQEASAYSDGNAVEGNDAIPEREAG